LLGGFVFWRLRPGPNTRRPSNMAHLALGAVLLLVWLPASLTFGFVTLSVPEPLSSLRVAYAFDNALAGLYRRIAPGTWPASYLGDAVKGRPFGWEDMGDPSPRPSGLFYPDGATLTLPAPSGLPIDRIETDSVAGAPLRVTIEIDDQLVGQHWVAPGRRLVCPQIATLAGPSGQVSVRLRPVGDSPPPAEPLWPIRVRSVGSTASRGPPPGAAARPRCS